MVHVMAGRKQRERPKQDGAPRTHRHLPLPTQLCLYCPHLSTHHHVITPSCDEHTGEVRLSGSIR